MSWKNWPYWLRVISLLLITIIFYSPIYLLIYSRNEIIFDSRFFWMFFHFSVIFFTLIWIFFFIHTVLKTKKEYYIIKSGLILSIIFLFLLMIPPMGSFIQEYIMEEPLREFGMMILGYPPMGIIGTPIFFLIGVSIGYIYGKIKRKRWK